MREPPPPPPFTKLGNKKHSSNPTTPNTTLYYTIYSQNFVERVFFPRASTLHHKIE